MSGEYIPTLLDQSDPAALPFRSHQDALDFASHGAEHTNRVLAANNLVNVVERYRESSLEIKVASDAAWVGNAGKCYLVFFAIPSDAKLNRGSYASLSSYSDTTSHGEGIEHLVLRDVTQLVHGPQGVIPSFVRLERGKESTDFHWQILAAASQVVEHLGFRWPERKLSGLRLLDSGVLAADCKSHLIENGAKVVGAVKDNIGEVVGQPLGELHLKKFCDSISVFLNAFGPWLILREGIDLPFQVGEVMLCTTEHTSWTFKDVSHDKTRPDKKP